MGISSSSQITEKWSEENFRNFGLNYEERRELASKYNSIEDSIQSRITSLGIGLNIGSKDVHDSGNEIMFSNKSDQIYSWAYGERDKAKKEIIEKSLKRKQAEEAANNSKAERNEAVEQETVTERNNV